MCYGLTRETAINSAQALALRVLADRVETGDAAPELKGWFVIDNDGAMQGGRRAKVSFDCDALRLLLVQTARERRKMTYGEVGQHFGYPSWTQGHTVALVSAMNKLAADNRRTGEPLLMALVVSKSTGLPGPGFYESTPGAGTTVERHEREVERVWRFAWPH